MADEPNDSNSPLLGHAQEDELWDQVEEAPPAEEITIQQLISERPEGVLEFLQDKGVRKLGEFVMQDRVVLGKLGDDSIATMGATKPVGDFEAAWRREMGAPKKDDKTGWTTCIPVLAYVVTIKDAAKPDKEGLLQPLLRRWQAGGCSYAAFSLPAVQAVIDWKWSRFCRKLLLWELAFFFLWLAAFSIFTIAFQDEDTSLSLRELLATSRGRLTVAMDFLALLGMAPFLLIEAATIAAYGWGWVQVWNILDTCTYVNQIAIVVMHLGRLNISSNWLSIAAAVQIILLLFRVQYFSRVFRPTRFAFVDSLKEVLHDVKYYLLFLVIIMFGFAAAFHILFREDQKKHDEFSTIGKSFITMVNWAAGNADINTMYKHSHNPVAASALAVVFVFVLAVVLMNLLIGILTNSLQRVTDNEGLRMLLSKAQVIDEIESTIPAWVERMFPQLYPPYLHVLRVDPDKLDSVKLDNLWSKEGEDEGPPILQENRSADSGHREQGGSTQLNGSGEGGSSREDALEQKLDAVMKELQELKSLLRPAGALHSEQ